MPIVEQKWEDSQTRSVQSQQLRQTAQTLWTHNWKQRTNVSTSSTQPHQRWSLSKITTSFVGRIVNGQALVSPDCQTDNNSSPEYNSKLQPATQYEQSMAFEQSGHEWAPYDDEFFILELASASEPSEACLPTGSSAQTRLLQERPSAVTVKLMRSVGEDPKVAKREFARGWWKSLSLQRTSRVQGKNLPEADNMQITLQWQKDKPYSAIPYH